MGDKWDTVWDLAKQSKDEAEFLAYLRTAGLGNEG